MSGIENFFPSRFLQSKEKNYIKAQWCRKVKNIGGNSINYLHLIFDIL